MISKGTWFPFIAFLLLFSASGYSQNINKSLIDTTEKILEIGRDDGGNESGSRIVILREDSAFYRDEHPNKFVSERRKYASADWFKLTQSIDLNDFDKLKNGKNERAIDGLDTHIYIKTSKRKHTLIIDSVNFKAIATMMEQLELAKKQFNEAEQVVEIQLDEMILVGGETDQESRFRITGDSLLYDKQIKWDAPGKKIHISSNLIPSKQNLLLALIKFIDLEKFDAVKVEPFGLPDRVIIKTISIKTTTGLHEEKNGVLDINTKKLMIELTKERNYLLTHF